MMPILDFIISILPVCLFLLLLTFLDSYKLIRLHTILRCIAIGFGFGLIGLLINLGGLKIQLFSLNLLVRFIGPLIEELLKILLPIYFIWKNKIGFTIDGTIIGFAVGCGFAVLENIFYFMNVDEMNIFFWVIRGFGTAIMHGGTTAIFTLITMSILGKKKASSFFDFIPGFLVAFSIHFLFNNVTINPLFKVLSQAVFLPAIFMTIFTHSEKQMKTWLQIGFDTNVALLNRLKSGQFQSSKTGLYLARFTSVLDPEIIFDMHCYLRIYLELAIRSKGVLMMQEMGFEADIEPEIETKFKELKYLEKSIGRMGKKIIDPLLNISVKELWQLYFLKDK